MSDPSPLPTPIPLPDELREKAPRQYVLTVTLPPEVADQSESRVRWYLDHAIKLYQRAWALDSDPMRHMNKCRVAIAPAPRQATLTATKPSGQVEPIAMLLFCPKCGAQHIDEAKGEWDGEAWTNPPHRSHLCHACGTIWRPADVTTVGVAAIETRGKADTWDAAQAKPSGQVERDAIIEECAKVAENLLGDDVDSAWEDGFDCAARRIAKGIRALAALSTQVQTVGGE